MALVDHGGVDVPAGIFLQEGPQGFFRSLGHEVVRFDEDFGVLRFRSECFGLFDGFCGLARGGHGAEASLAGAGLVRCLPRLFFYEREQLERPVGILSFLGRQQGVSERRADGCRRGAGEIEPGAEFFPMLFEGGNVLNRCGADGRLAGWIDCENDRLNIASRQGDGRNRLWSGFRLCRDIELQADEFLIRRNDFPDAAVARFHFEHILRVADGCRGEKDEECAFHPCSGDSSDGFVFSPDFEGRGPPRACRRDWAVFDSGKSSSSVLDRNSL